MATKNDVTGDDIASKSNNDKYRDGFAVIFHKDRCERCGKILFEDHIHTCTPKEGA